MVKKGMNFMNQEQMMSRSARIFAPKDDGTENWAFKGKQRKQKPTLTYFFFK